MPQIIPAVLAKTKQEFIIRLSNQPLRALAPLWQIDVLDGSLFDQTSFFDTSVAASLSPLPEIELHLMIANPLPVIREWHERIPSLRRATVHAEIDRQVGTVLDEIAKLNIETGIALNPETPLEDFLDHIERADVLLILGVHPGKSGQAFLGESILEKIRDARNRFPKKIIAVDGGINQSNIQEIVTAGANQVCIASAIWNNNHPEGDFTELQALI